MKRSLGPFNYENYLRNEEMMQKDFKPPMPFDSGTTVVGIVFNGGVMIGTDTRGTRKNIISTSASAKIHRLHNNIYCGGSGYASDLIQLTGLISAELELHYSAIGGRCLPVVCAKQLLKEALMRLLGKIMASFILAGVDRSGVHLYSVHFDGTTEKCLFNSIGSGQFSAMGILENRWQKDMNEADARELILDAVAAGIKNDLASGSTVDLVVIRDDFSVQLCSEVLYQNLRTEKLDPPCNQSVKTQTDPDWMRNILIIKEQVIPLSPQMTPTATPTPSSMAVFSELWMALRCPIRSDEVRRTTGSTRLKRKRSTSTIEDSERPFKRIKID